MKIFSIIKISVLFLLFASLVAFVGEPDDINKALKSGDYELLKNKMNQTVELVILEKENVYSKTQAEQILKQFFSVHKPISYTLIHNGGSQNSQYYIGTLKTEKENYRVYYLLKTRENKTLIYQLRIESDE